MSLNLNNIALTGSGRSGVPYTEAEKNLALMVLTQMTGLVGREVIDPVDITDEVVVAVSEAAEEAEKPTVAGICRAAYNRVSDAHFNDGNATEPTKFPKERDWTSIGLLFRNAASHKSLSKAYSKEEVNEMFKAYWKKKAG